MIRYFRKGLALCTAAVLAAGSLYVSSPVLATTLEEDTAVAGMAVSLGNYYANNATAEADIMEYLRPLAAAAKEEAPARSVAAEIKDDGSSVFERTLISEEDQILETGLVSVVGKLNVRNQPSMYGNVVGYLYSNCVVSIYKKISNDSGDWYLIRCGEVEGYVSADYVLTGEAAAANREDLSNRYAVVTAENTAVRNSANPQAAVLGTVYRDETYRVLELQGDFAKLYVSEELVGYVDQKDISMFTKQTSPVAITDEMVRQQLEGYLTDINYAQRVYSVGMSTGDYAAAYSAITYAYELWGYYIADADNAGYTELAAQARIELAKVLAQVNLAKAALEGGLEPTGPSETEPTVPDVTEPTEPDVPDVTPPTVPDVTEPTEPDVPDVTPPTDPDVTEPTEPDVPDVTPPTDPDVTEPTEPDVPDVTPPTDPDVTEPTTPETEPETPSVTEPTSPETEPETPSVTESTSPPTDPETPPVTEPTLPPTDPETPPVTEPTLPPTDPETPPVTEPTLPPTDPETPPVTEPTLPPTDPETPPVTEPTLPPTEPEQPETPVKALTGIAAVYIGEQKYEGQVIGAAEIYVEAYYNDNTAAIVTEGWTCDMVGMLLTAGTTTVTVYYGGYSYSFTVEVLPVPTTPPTDPETPPATEPTVPPTEPTVPDITLPPEVSSPLRDAVINYAMQFVGRCNYVWGGTNLAIGGGVDCSGFTMCVFRDVAGVALPHYSMSQLNYGAPISFEQLRPGDLVFYNDPNHVAIYIGDGMIVHAMNPQTGIAVTSIFFKIPIAYRSLLP